MLKTLTVQSPSHQTNSPVEKSPIASTLLQRLLEPACRHAALVQALAAGVRDQLRALGGDAHDGNRRSAAVHAKEHEREADAIVVEMRSLADRLPSASRFGRIVEAADNAADALEEAMFQLTLLPEPPAVPAATLPDRAQVVVAQGVDPHRPLRRMAGRIAIWPLLG